MGRVVGGRDARCHQGRAMTALEKPRRDYLALAFGVILAAVFMYAGAAKFSDPLQFADSIAAFAILPPAVINLLAFSLPPFEIACGLLLLWPRTRRVGALAVALISVVFFVALSSALLRGLTIDCGCFGAGAPSRPRMWVELGLDVTLIGASVFVYLRPAIRPAQKTPRFSSSQGTPLDSLGPIP
jgi:putative oxidoreductase